MLQRVSQREHHEENTIFVLQMECLHILKAYNGQKYINAYLDFIRIITN
jgi:hypothetical protein